MIIDAAICLCTAKRNSGLLYSVDMVKGLTF